MEESIVNHSFCAPEPINLTFYTKASWLKDGDTLAVTSADGVVVSQVKSRFRDRQELVDNTGKTVLSVKKQTRSSHEQWQVFKGDSSHPKYLLFTMKKSPNFDSEEVFDLFLKANTAETKCDYKIKGSYGKKTCILYEGESSTIAFEMHRRSISDNSAVSQEEAFKVAGQASMDYMFVVAVVEVLHVHHCEQGKKETEWMESTVGKHINSFSYLEGLRSMEESIVNRSFQASEPINFTFYTKASWLKDGDELAVTGADGVVIFQVQSSFWNLWNKQEFVNNTRKTLLSVKKQTRSSHEKWLVFKGASSDPKDVLFTTKKSPNFDSDEVFDLFLQGNTAEKKCDYKIKGSYHKKTCILYEGDSSIVALEMNRRSRSADCAVSQEEAFKVAGQLSIDCLFVVAVVAFLHVHHSEQEKKQTKGKKIMVAKSPVSNKPKVNTF